MKRILFIGALLGARASTAHAQTIQVMTEQLLALKSLQQTVAAGYQLMETKTDSIGQITAKEYQLHETYLESLTATKIITYDTYLFIYRY